MAVMWHAAEELLLPMSASSMYLAGLLSLLATTVLLFRKPVLATQTLGCGLFVGATPLPALSA